MKHKFIFLIWFFIFNTFVANAAVILLYHHVSDTSPESTSVKVDTFTKHLNYLQNNNFKVLPLDEVLSSLEKGKELPAKSVVITFDDAYKSILENALPLLKEKKYPFTVFINTQSIDVGYKNFLTWEELKILQKNNALIANHTHTHTHLVRKLKEEKPHAWKQRITKDILMAKRILKEKLEVSNRLFAYPYGEYNQDVKRILKSLDYFGIAQQSGAIGVGFNKYEIPRFAMTTKYADIKRFATSVNSKQLSVSNVDIGSRILRVNQTDTQDFYFELQEGNYLKQYLACYDSWGKQLNIMVNNQKVIMQLPSWSQGRQKINCTAPSRTHKGVFYWYSQLWLIKDKKGNWYKE